MIEVDSSKFNRIEQRLNSQAAIILAACEFLSTLIHFRVYLDPKTKGVSNFHPQ